MATQRGQLAAKLCRYARSAVALNVRLLLRLLSGPFLASLAPATTRHPGHQKLACTPAGAFAWRCVSPALCPKPLQRPQTSTPGVNRPCARS